MCIHKASKCHSIYLQLIYPSKIETLQSKQKVCTNNPRINYLKMHENQQKESYFHCERTSAQKTVNSNNDCIFSVTAKASWYANGSVFSMVLRLWLIVGLRHFVVVFIGNIVCNLLLPRKVLEIMIPSIVLFLFFVDCHRGCRFRRQFIGLYLNWLRNFIFEENK